MTKEIVDILNKYKSEGWCQDIIENTAVIMQSDIDLLYEIQKKLSKKLYKTSLSAYTENSELCHNILNDIEFIKKSRENYKELKKALPNSEFITKIITS